MTVNQTNNMFWFKPTELIDNIISWKLLISFIEDIKTKLGIEYL